MRPGHQQHVHDEDGNVQMEAIDLALEGIPDGMTNRYLKRLRRTLEDRTVDVDDVKRHDVTLDPYAVSDPAVGDAENTVHVRKPVPRAVVFGDDDVLTIARIVTSLRSRGDEQNAAALSNWCAAVQKRID